jgi:arsenate reductase
MSAIEVFHNQNCSKSREVLAILEENQIATEAVNYLDNPPSHKELAILLRKLNIPIRDMIRKNEPEYKRLGLDDNSLDETSLLRAICENPILNERPIVIKNEVAVIGRPITNLLKLLKA